VLALIFSLASTFAPQFQIAVVFAFSSLTQVSRYLIEELLINYRKFFKILTWSSGESAFVSSFSGQVLEDNGKMQSENRSQN